MEQNELELETQLEELVEETADESNEEEIVDQEVEPDDGDLVVTIGDEVSEDDKDEGNTNNSSFRDLRKAHRDSLKRIRELEEQTRTAVQPVKKQEIGKEPELSDYEYDEDKFKSEWRTWNLRKLEVENEEKKRIEAEEKEKQAWNDRLKAYSEEKVKLKAPDFDEAESVALATFSKVQQGIIVQGADKPALLMYVSGKNLTKAKQLAEIKDPVKFAFAIAKLETQVKTGRKAPQPEKIISSTGSKSGAVNGTLENLRKEAEKTGDYSKVAAYKRQQRSK